MLPDDPNFNKILFDTFAGFPFRRLPQQVAYNKTEQNDEDALVDAFAHAFSHPDAYAARNVVFFWAVERPFQHENGMKLSSTISYIEITKNTLAARWPRSCIRRATSNSSKKGVAQRDEPLQRLADLDKGFWFYGRLLEEHGPLTIYYATLSNLNEAAVAAGFEPKATARDWERHLITAYRRTHGVRPFKNRSS